MKLALTGLIAGGKSSALEELRRLGWLTLAADALAKKEAQTPKAHEFLRAYFGGELPTLEALRARFAADKEFRQAWENLLHPQVNAAWRTFADANPCANVAVEIPLLFEKKLEKDFDIVVVCKGSAETAMARWVKAGRSAEDYKALTKLLLPIEEKITRAHFVLNSDLPLDEFLSSVRALHQKLCLKKI